MKNKQVDPSDMLPDTSEILLKAAAPGQWLRLVKIDAGKQLTHRLIELGLTPGVQFMIVHDSGGPMVLSVRDSRVAIGRGMAAKMRVTAV